MKKIRIKKYAQGIQRLNPRVDPNLSIADYSDYSSEKDMLANKAMAGKQAATGVANAVGSAFGVPFAGDILNAGDMLASSVLKDKEGNYKNQFAKTIDSTLNPFSKIGALTSGNTSDITDAFTFGFGSKIAKGLGLDLGKSSQDILEEKKKKAEMDAAYNAENAKYAGRDETLNMPRYRSGVRYLTKYRDGVDEIKEDDNSMDSSCSPKMKAFKMRYLNKYKDGTNSIHIKEKNNGTFTESANKAGMSVGAYAKHILANKTKYSPLMVKRAVFANNFGGSQ